MGNRKLLIVSIIVAGLIIGYAWLNSYIVFYMRHLPPHEAPTKESTPGGWIFAEKSERAGSLFSIAERAE